MAYKEKNKWTVAQLNMLIENYGTVKDELLAEALGKTLKAVRRKRARLKLIKASGRGICAKLSDVQLSADREDDEGSVD